MNERYSVTAEFPDGPGECGEGGAYTEIASSPEEAMLRTLSQLASMPEEMEASDEATHTRRAAWGREQITLGWEQTAKTRAEIWAAARAQAAQL